MASRELEDALRRLRADQAHMWRASGGSGENPAPAVPIPPSGQPDPFGWAAYPAAPLSSFIVTLPVVLSGAGSPWLVTATVGEVSVNGGAFGTSGVASAGDSVRSRVLSSALTSTLVTGSVNIGGTIGQFAVTTVQQAASSVLFLRVGIPAEARRQLIDTCINSLVVAGVWAKLDALYLFAAVDQVTALANWKGPVFDCTLSATAPAFLADRGFTGNGSTAYVDSNMPDNGGTTWAPSGSAASFYLYANVAGAVLSTSYAFGLPVSIAVRCNLMTGTTMNSRLHTGGSQTATVATRAGATAVSRTVTDLRVFKDGVFVMTVGGGTTAPVAENLRFLSSALGACTDRLACGAMGGTMTDADEANLHAAVLAYLTAIGGQ